MASPAVPVRDIWGIHDFIPDYQAFTSTAEYMLAAERGAKIPGGPSGCGFYRIIQPLDALRDQLGWTTGYAAGEPADLDSKIIVAQRMDKHAALPFWRRWRAHSRLVYEIDDNVFDVDITNWMAFGAYGKAEVRDAVEHAAQVADMVTVTTEPLAAVMRPFNGNVRVIPNVIPDAVLGMERLHQPKVVVGWQGGASHARDLALIAPSLRHVLDKHGKRAELHIRGTDYRETIGRPGRFTKWIPVAADLDYFRGIDFDIGLAPLTGTHFDQSKSAIKAIEYAAMGIPVLASDVDPYRDFITGGVNGYLCKRKADWGRRLEELICDDAARQEMGRNARESARAHTMSTGIKRWAAAYEELI
jgi:hypothetical protein